MKNIKIDLETAKELLGRFPYPSPLISVYDEYLYFTYGGQYRWHLDNGTLEELTKRTFEITDSSKRLMQIMENEYVLMQTESYLKSTSKTPLRKVKFNRWIPRVIEEIPRGNGSFIRGTNPGTNKFEEGYPNEGLFHCWGSDYEEYDSGPGNFSVAIVELPDGSVENVLPENIKFIS